MTSWHKTGAHPFYIGMYIHIYTHIYVHKYTSQKECLHIFHPAANLAKLWVVLSRNGKIPFFLIYIIDGTSDVESNRVTTFCQLRQRRNITADPLQIRPAAWKFLKCPVSQKKTNEDWKKNWKSI